MFCASFENRLNCEELSTKSGFEIYNNGDFMEVLLQDWLLGLGLPKDMVVWSAKAVLIVSIILLAVIVNWIAKKIILRLVGYMVKRTPMQWDDALLANRVFHRMSHVAPAMVIYYMAFVFSNDATLIVQRFAMAYMIFIGLLVIDAFLDTCVSVYRSFEVSKTKPIKGYIQVVKIFSYLMGIIIIVSTIVDKSPWGLVSGIGALSAVLMLVFKDSILGFVAGIQITANDIVAVGDWIDMPKHHVSGDVVDIALTTVKVQNFDKSIVSIPAYLLISQAVINWRGMQQAGARRVKRSFYIDMNSVKFCDAQTSLKFSKFSLIKNYIDDKQKEVTQYNEENKVDTSELINGRRLTNVGCLRAYIVEYLKSHPKIRQDMTLLVRHLEPTEHGLPIQLYVFSNDTNWINFEGIQSDIFDHILAVIPEFDLRVYQRPSGSDLVGVANRGVAA
jgi:miniconductance mechanosensitive channel